MALSSTIVWEVRNAGNVNNGGGYKTGSTGTDFSQQDAAQYALTSVTTAGADAILLHASAADDMVGNIARIVSGTNFTVGYYEIISVVVGVSITLDRTCATGAGVSGVVNIGGALTAIGSIGSATVGLGAVAGNIIWIKADGAYSLGATDTLNMPGTNTNPIWVKGYKTTRGDGYLGRNTGDGKLITTNMPAYAFQAGFRVNISTGTFIYFETINFTGAVSSYLLSMGTDCFAYGCVFDNNSTNSSASCVALSTRAILFNCDAILEGATGGLNCLQVDSSNSKVIACWVQNQKTSGTSVGISLGSGGFAINCVVLGSGAATGISVAAGATSSVVGCTVIGYVNGIAYASSLTGLQFAMSNMITDCGTNAIDCGGTGVPLLQAFNRLRDAITIANAGSTVTGTSYGNITTDGAAYSDYVDYNGSSSLDIRLATSSPARNAAIPASASMGARQLAATSSTTIVAPQLIQRNLPDIKVY